DSPPTPGNYTSPGQYVRMLSPCTTGSQVRDSAALWAQRKVSNNVALLVNAASGYCMKPVNPAAGGGNVTQVACSEADTNAWWAVQAQPNGGVRYSLTSAMTLCLRPSPAAGAPLTTGVCDAGADFWTA